MKVIDIIFALISGGIISFLVGDFLKGLGIKVEFYWSLVVWLFFPIISLICLWLAFLIGKKLLFVFQSAKFFLIGAVATVFDLKIFEFLVWIFSIYIPIGSIAAKSISFLIATFFKYWGNKYWAFQEHEFFDYDQGRQKHIYKEITQFFLITFVGLVIDVASFYYLTKVMGPQFAIPYIIWIKLSVIFAAITAALWNFLGYKFLVFKK